MSAPDFDFDEAVEEDQKADYSGGASGPRIPDVEESATDFILDALDQKDGAFEMKAFARDASAMPENFIDHYGFDEGTTNSVQDLFELDWDGVDFVGTEPLAQNPNHPSVDDTDVTEEELDLLPEAERTTKSGDPKKYIPDPEYATQFRDANIDDSTLSALSRGINAHRNDDIVERFGEDSRVKVSIGKKRNTDRGDAAEQRTNVHFSISDSETAADKREEWAAELENGDGDEDDEEEE